MPKQLSREVPAALGAAERQRLHWAESNADLLAEASYAPWFEAIHREVPRILAMERDDPAPLQPWPALVEPATHRRWWGWNHALSQLLRSLPERFFASDPAALFDFLGVGSELLFDLVLSEPDGVSSALFRGDYLLTEEGLRCIELNVGAVGGWQNIAYGRLYEELPVWRRFLSENGLRAHFDDTVERMFEHAVRSTREAIDPPGSEINLLILVAESGLSVAETHPQRLYEDLYRRALGAVNPALRGQLLVAPNADLTFRRGQVRCGETAIHAVIEQDTEVTSRPLFRAFKAGSVHLLTGPLSMIFGDKRWLALMSTHQESDRFDEAERELIRQVVPWTRQLGPHEATWQGEAVFLPEWVEQAREELIIKSGQGYGGREIYIGCRTSPEEWRQAVADALDDGQWIVQEYLPTVPSPALARGGGWQPHDVVWGLFDLGDGASGGFLRSAPRQSEGRGVLNLVQGARIGLYFEVESE
ncbi:MAG: hypothetical protein AAF604_11825 [Acidobacteriota bacterium]